jgi:SagB-type dehydrogenase family enzyme
MAFYESESQDSEPAAWELYHENSKIGRSARMPFEADRRSPAKREPAAIYEASPSIPLAEIGELHAQLGTAMRIEMRLRAGRLPRKALATLLSHARGMGEAGREAIDLFFHAAAVEEVPNGLYLYDRAAKAARLVRRGDLSERLAANLLSPELVGRSAAQIFVAGAFESAVSSFDERGYRLALMAAGALARDLNLAASAIGLGSVATAAFYDRDIDAMLALDGLRRSTLLVIAIGAAGKEPMLPVGRE